MQAAAASAAHCRLSGLIMMSSMRHLSIFPDSDVSTKTRVKQTDFISVRLLRQLSASAILVSRVGKYEHVEAPSKIIHWLRVVAVLAQRCLRGTVPDDLSAETCVADDSPRSHLQVWIFL
jgi:hypothetical protein